MNWAEFLKIFEDCEIINDKIVIKSGIVKAIDFIKNHYGFEILKEIVAIDTKNGIELKYRLYSMENEEDVIVSQIVENETESVCTIFDSACADEKEIYDLFGVKFLGNPELKRLYMPEGWEGHPLKKDYVEKDERLNWNE